MEVELGHQFLKPLSNAMQFCDFDRTTSVIKIMLGENVSTSDDSASLIKHECLKALQYASYQGNANLVDYFLQIGLVPDPACLCEAVRGNNHHIVLKYLQAGVKLDCSFDPSRLALHSDRFYTGHFSPDVEPCLLEKCSIQPVTTTPFAEAIRWNHQELSQLFLDLGILETITETVSFTAALCAAAEAGNKTVIQLLLGLASPTLEPIFLGLSTSISVAALGNHEEIIELLMAAGIQPTSSSITSAILVRNKRLVRLFLDTAVSTTHNDGLIYFAVRWGDVDVIKQLINAGALINASRFAMGIFYRISLTSEDVLSPLGEAISKGNHQVVQLLLDNGADISMSKRVRVCSPLKAAIKCGNEPFACELLARGADPNDPEALQAAISLSSEMTGAIIGAFCRRYPTGDKSFAALALLKAIRDKNEMVVQILAKHANLNDVSCVEYDLERLSLVHGHRRKFGYSPTLLGEGIATRSYDIVRILLDSGGNPNSTVATELPHPYRGRWTGISEAIFTGDLAMVELLYSDGADLHFSATLGITHTSLQLAVELGHYDIVRFLLKHGVDVNAPPCVWGGGTALQRAAITGSIGIAEMLLQYGADVNAPRSRYAGKTAFESAAEHGRMDMLLLLFHKGVDIVSDGGEQVRRAKGFAEKNGQVAAKGLVEQLAETVGLGTVLTL
jgi:ankyrin repeat protein